MTPGDMIVVVCSCGQVLTMVYRGVFSSGGNYGTKLEPLVTFPESVAATHGSVEHIAYGSCGCGKYYEAKNGDMFCNGKPIGSVPE